MSMNQNRHTKTAVSGSAAVRCEQARDMFNDALKCGNCYGLLTEDVHPLTGELWAISLRPTPWLD
jgi:hypothetical protein